MVNEIKLSKCTIITELIFITEQIILQGKFTFLINKMWLDSNDLSKILIAIGNEVKNKLLIRKKRRLNLNKSKTKCISNRKNNLKGIQFNNESL